MIIIDYTQDMFNFACDKFEIQQVIYPSNLVEIRIPKKFSVCSTRLISQGCNINLIRITWIFQNGCRKYCFSQLFVFYFLFCKFEKISKFKKIYKIKIKKKTKWNNCEKLNTRFHAKFPSTKFEILWKFRKFEIFGNLMKFWKFYENFQILWNFWKFMKIWGEKNFFRNSNFPIRSVFVINVSLFTSVVCYCQNGLRRKHGKCLLCNK
jgi:hypothetical protein